MSSFCILRNGKEQEAKEIPTIVIRVLCRIEAEISKAKAKLGMRALKEEQELERKLE